MYSTTTRSWLSRILRMESSLTRDFAVLSGVVIFVVMMLCAWIGWQVYTTNKTETRAKLETEIYRVDNALAGIIDNAKYVMEALSRQIFLYGLHDHSQVAKILRTFDTRPDIYGLFAWVDENQKLIISSNKGVISDSAVDVSDREYQRSAREYPWKVHIGTPIAGRSSGKWVLPVVMGLTDDTGRYVGTIVISVDIEGLTSRINKDLSTSGLSYALVSRDLTVLGEGTNQKFSIDENMTKNKVKSKNIEMDTSKGIKPANFIEENGQTAFYSYSNYYDYFVLLSYDKTQAYPEILSQLGPRLIQLIGTAFVLLGVLWLIRNRIIGPVIGLSTAASSMARGKQDVVVPIEGPVEISNLAHQIQRVKEFLEERKRVEDELRRKNVALKDAKEQSELADQTKSEFLACMSHELRTPLNAIIGFADVMMNGYYGKIENNKYSQYIEDIYNSGQHLLEIINDILDLAKVESGVMALHESRIDVEKLVLKSIRLLSDRAQMSGIILDADMPDRMPVIQGDPLRIKQVLINLLSNAIKYTPEGGHICVKVDYDSRRPMPLTIHVMDTGVGMTPEQIPLALSKFGQVDGDYTKKNQGTGLGLPLSLELMRLHQGSLDITSEYGQGTTASISFPAARVVMPENELA